MKLTHTLQHSALAYQNLWMIKSTMPSYWHSPHHLTVYHNLTSYQMMMMMKLKWYTPAHVHQNEHSNKCVCFSKSTKTPKPILHETPEIEFKLGMNIIFKDGTRKSNHFVYKGATANGLKHVIRCYDGSWSNIDQSHLSFTNQIGFEYIPQTPLNYCKEVGIGITQEQAQWLACPWVLTPQQQELMSWHHCLYHLPFNRILMLAKSGYLPKIQLKLQDKLPLCVVCQFGTAHWCPWCTKDKKSGSIWKPDQTKLGDGVSVDQITSAQPGLIPQIAGFLTSKQIWGCTTCRAHGNNLYGQWRKYIRIIWIHRIYEPIYYMKSHMRIHIRWIHIESI